MSDPVLHVSVPEDGARPAVRVLFWLLLGYVAFVTVSPIAFRPITPFGPHIERFAAFCAISGLATLAYPRHRLRWCAALLIVAALLEAAQTLVPGRHGRMIDFDVKALGIFAGCCATLFLDWLTLRIGRVLGPRHR